MSPELYEPPANGLSQRPSACPTVDDVTSSFTLVYSLDGSSFLLHHLQIIDIILLGF